MAVMELDPGARRVLDLIREAGRPSYESLQPSEARALYRKGRALLPIIDDMRAYGEDWLAAECSERSQTARGILAVA